MNIYGNVILRFSGYILILERYLIAKSLREHLSIGAEMLYTCFGTYLYNIQITDIAVQVNSYICGHTDVIPSTYHTDKKYSNSFTILN